ncbi:chemotaxis protein CheW [Halostagnicola bangensis]
MSEDPSDPDDEFEDQLSDVGSRTREKLSAEEQKKAEKLGVSPSASTTPSSDEESSEAAGTDDGSTAGAGTDSTTGDDDSTEQPPPSSDGSVDTGSDSGTVYEYNDMNSELEHEPEASLDDQQPAAEPGTDEPASGPTAGLGSVATGERMAVTKTEIDFVTGDEAETKETEKTKLLYFELNDELFAAPLESISSVEELSGLTRYPRSPAPIDGVTDMRGKIIAVLNPKVIVDLSNASHEDGAGGDYIIVQEEIEDEHRLGVRVDDISHVESATESDITPIYDISEMDLVTIDESYLEGIIHGYRADEQAQVPLVDFSALMETLKEY